MQRGASRRVETISTVGKRERMFSYTRYLDILNEGAEPL